MNMKTDVFGKVFKEHFKISFVRIKSSQNSKLLKLDGKYMICQICRTNREAEKLNHCAEKK